MTNPFVFPKPILDLLKPFRKGEEDDFTLENFLKWANNGAALEKAAADFDYAAWYEKFLYPANDERSPMTLIRRFRDGRQLVKIFEEEDGAYPREVAFFVDMWLRAAYEQIEIEGKDYESIEQREKELLQAIYPDYELNLAVNKKHRTSPEFIVRTMMGAKELCERLHKEGFSKEFATELIELVNEFNFEARLVFQEELNRFAWKHSLSKEQTAPSHHICLFHFALLIESGELMSVKRCELEDCRKFHNRRGKWCSDNCGSLYRGRKKRDRDKAHGDYESRYTYSFFE